MRTLFDDIPAQRHSETSVAAAESIRPDANRLRAVVLDAIRRAVADGMTDEEGIAATGIFASTYRPRRAASSRVRAGGQGDRQREDAENGEREERGGVVCGGITKPQW